MQRLQIIGNLGADARIIEPENGNAFVTFSVAVNEVYSLKTGEKITKTYWYNVITNAVKIAPYLIKGKQVFVEGTPDVNTYEDKNGIFRASLQLRAQRIQLLGAGRASEDSQPQPKATAAAASPMPPPPPQQQAQANDNDLPF